jgi:membrane-associated PAP2 superfamily phosphatase
MTTTRFDLLRGTNNQYWWHYARLPLLLYTAAVLALRITDLDIAVAQSWFYSSGHWLGADHGWIKTVIHGHGRWLIRAAAIGVAALWVATFFAPRLRHWRRASAYFLLATATTVALAGLLKAISNVDCPWDLQLFGGHYPYIPLFADRPGALRHAACFPAAHAASGYALLALYFIAKEYSQRAGHCALALGLTCGLVFGIAQQARGAHFVSHDLCSAILAWLSSLTWYALGFNCRLSAGAASEFAVARLVSPPMAALPESD